MADLPNAKTSYHAQHVALLSGAQNELIDTISNAIDKACIKIGKDEEYIEYNDYFIKYVLAVMFDQFCGVFDSQNDRGDAVKAMVILEKLHCKVARWQLNNRTTYDKNLE